jgi:hypothetical protein
MISKYQLPTYNRRPQPEDQLRCIFRRGLEALAGVRQTHDSDYINKYHQIRVFTKRRVVNPCLSIAVGLDRSPQMIKFFSWIWLPNGL